MKTYQIRVNVEIVPCTESPTPEPVQQQDGSFQITLAEPDAISIDTCERALLQTAYPTLREALATHLSEVSKKKALERMTEGTVVTNPWPYQVDGEVGRFEFVTYQIVHDGKTVYNTAREVFPGLRRWERYTTSGFKELAYLDGAIEGSYRKTTKQIKRIRYQVNDGTPSRTLREQAVGEGSKLMKAIDHKARQILKAHDFREDGTFKGESTAYQGHGVVSLPDAQVAEAISVCQAQVKGDCDLSTNPVGYEAPEYTVNITIDDVGAKRQTAERTCHPQVTDTVGREPKAEQNFVAAPGKRSAAKKRKYVHTTVIHVEKATRSYLIIGHGLKHVLSVLIAFLLNSDLLHCRLQFFSDGYTILHEAIRRCFAWYPNLAIILDWYHLKEKCKMQLSLAMKGRVIRNDALGELLPLLWYGLVDQAIASVNALPQSQIKNPEALTKLIGYFERNRAHIPCYAVRKELGLRNSSQIGEKMNDLVVSDRQKGHGMSWSVSGSVALAALTALARNNESVQWFHEGDVTFKFAA